MTDGSVMIVDDDPDIVDTMTMVLESFGYRVLAAHDGRRALDLLHAGARPALIVLDLMMPVMDGRAFRAAQRREPALAAIPVVVISGDTEAIEHVADLGVAGTLCKPFDVDTLLAAVAQHRSTQPGPPDA